MENSKNYQSDWDSEKQGPRSSNAPRMEPSSQTDDQTPGSGETRLLIPKSESLKTAGCATKSPLIIAVANQKGGVAKTTTVVSLGGALTQLGSEVLLIDLDAQANLTLALGKDPNRVRGSITDVLFHSATLLSVSRETSIPGLDLVPSNTGMELAERFLPVRKDYETILRRTIVEELRRPDSEIPNEYCSHQSILRAKFSRHSIRLRPA